MSPLDIFGNTLVAVLIVALPYMIWRLDFSPAAKKRDAETAERIGRLAGQLVAGAIREATLGKEKR